MTLIDKKIINRNASLNKKKIPQYARGKQDSVRCIVISCNLISKNLQHGIKRILITYSQRVLK